MPLENLKSSRRGFLTGAGVLGFAILADGSVSVFNGTAGEAQSQDLGGRDITAWVTISPDNAVTIRYGAAEMGQGVNTSLPMILAEELDADWDTVSVEQVSADPDGVYGNPGFGGMLFAAGSSSLEGYFTYLRQAGAQARHILVSMAATHWGVEPAEVSTSVGHVVHTRTGRRMSYGRVVELPAPVAAVATVTEDQLKPRSEWRIMGTDVPREDIPAKTRGAGLYSIDVDLPEMLHAAQLLAPVEGEEPVGISDAAALAIPGVVQVVRLQNSVAVLAESFAAALAGRDALEVTWTETSPFRNADSAQELDELFEAVDDQTREAVVWESRGDGALSLNRDAAVHSARFTTEHVYHAQMEPLNAVASVDDDGKGAEVWLGTQSQSVSIAIAAAVLDTTPDRIRFHATQMGGAFGRRTVFARDLLRDVLHLSRVAGRPVKLVWTREDDVKNGWLRPATAHRLDAVLDDKGNIMAMRHRIASPSIMQFAFPNRWDPQSQRDLLVMEGAESSEYAVANFQAEQVILPRRSRVSAWRGIGWAPNCYARECFIDEMAEAADSDPVAFRRNLLRDSPRGLGVLNAAVEMSRFGQVPQDRAHGLSFAGYKRTMAAGVAEVSVDENGFIVHKMWAAIDPGIVVHPENYRAQTEGGILFGLSSLLRERTTFTGGVIDQSNFYDYEPLRISEIPEIEIAFVESGVAPSGGGEIGVPMTGAAVANAIRVLTGRTPRNIPFSVVGA
ncbi:xanthine dehydrogenase family protein molybdopterin-binding subunit [Roseibium aggregatum]|uniref:xanthine dehydrogenase family protein molybdopterin-binding subunit n=1 Tax=Roseibium aggregatum TaxID=187304 RepID=UPI001E561342|nr:molybdopterin cofactor-binding domain-containing protein [Roseibium aggregatum]